MPPRYAAVGLAVVVDALAITILCTVLALFYWLATGTPGGFLRTTADALFIAGGIALTFGALIEFFHFKGTREICRLLYYPQRRLARRGHVQAAATDSGEEAFNAGWTLIFIGILVIAISFVVTLDYII